MKLLKLFLFSLFILLTSFALASGDRTAATQSIAPMLKTVMPAVVNIQAVGDVTLSGDMLQELLQLQQQSGQPLPPIPKKFTKLGSGVVVNAAQGYILTNAHVVKDAKVITVRFSDQSSQIAKLVGLDEASDIAVLKVKPKGLHAIPLGDSNKLQVGDFVAAIGNPFGLNQTVTSGIISALQRNDLRIEGYENFIQTDAAINPGNSGGALVNMKGQLIGINTAILSASGGNIGIGFAIPINMANALMQQLIQFGNVKRGVLGLMGQPLTPSLAAAMNTKILSGVVITSINTGSAAEKAGLKVGDIITAVNGQPVSDPMQLRNVIGLIRAGNKVSLTIIRNKKTLSIHATLTEAQQQQAAAAELARFLYGVALRNVTQTNTSQEDVQGVQVIAVTEDSAAFVAGLMPGDIIVSAQQQPVHSIKELQDIAKQAKDSLLLNVQRQGGALFVVIKPLDGG